MNVHSLSKLWILLFAAVSPSLLSCERELDFKYHEIPAIPVIESTLSEAGSKVGITLTTPMDEPMDLTRYTDAYVMLHDLSAGEFMRLLPDEEGFFISDTPGIIGHDYRLVVVKEGVVYSSETTMFGPVDILSLEFNWISMPYDEVAVLQCRYTDNPLVADECYWVRVYRNGEIYMWSAQSDRIAESGVMTFFAMTSRRDLDAEDEDSALRDGDVVTVTVSPISRTMHDYLEALGNDSSGPRLFRSEFLDPEDSKRDDRTLTGCLGYFMASSTVECSTVFHPDEIPMASESPSNNNGDTLDMK